MFSKSQTFYLLMLLLAGFLVAAKLYHIDYMVNYSAEPYKSFCNVNESFNCDAVAASPYSQFLGIPIAFIGATAHLFLIVFLFIGPKLSGIRAQLKTLYLSIFFVYSIACLILAAISFLLVSALCFVCMIFWVIVFCTFAFLAIIGDPSDLKTPIKTSLGLLGALFQHKAITFGYIIIYFAVNTALGYQLTQQGCPQKKQNPLQCEHFDSQLQTAFLGRDSAKINVYIYTDFQCPWCRRAHYALVELVKKYEKQVRFIRKEFPLDIQCNPLLKNPFHPIACQAAYYSKCAGQQGKYWQYHDELYKNQEFLSEEVFLNIGKLLSLDTAKLKDCANSQFVQKIIKAEINEAAQYHIDGTPTFRIFAELFVGMINQKVLEDYISSYPAIKPAVLQRILTGSAEILQLVDIRSEEDYQKGHIDGAISVPLATLRASPTTKYLNKNMPTLLYDQNGTRVTAAFDLLQKQGFDTIHTLLGGYSRWTESSLANQAATNLSKAVNLVGN